jgi:hypothetical protein
MRRTYVIPVVDDFTSHTPDGVGINLVNAREHLSERQVAAEANELPADLFASGVSAFGAGQNAGLEHGASAQNVFIRNGVGKIKDAALQLAVLGTAMHLQGAFTGTRT